MAGSKKKRSLGIFRGTLLAISIVACAAFALLYVARPDAAAAMTVVPVWFWALPGLLFAFLGFRTNRPLPALGVTLAWLLYLVLLAEEPISLLHGGPWPAHEWLEARSKGKAIRVISLNCAGGDPGAAAEVAPFHPDIVLLQETPGEGALRALAKKMFGDTGTVLVGWDASIVTRYGVPKAYVAQAKKRPHFVMARVSVPGYREIEVVSLRLAPPIVRGDLWSPDCWRAQTRLREVHRGQVRAIATELGRSAEYDPCIVGGDFNSQQGDAIFREFPLTMRDSFAEAGRGLGDTGPNDYPLERIDEIWTGTGLRPVSVIARKTRNSDHRMVICDLILE